MSYESDSKDARALTVTVAAGSPYTYTTFQGAVLAFQVAINRRQNERSIKLWLIVRVTFVRFRNVTCLSANAFSLSLTHSSFQ